ncbi:MAG: methyltransferase domain-containing protein [Terriglobales bacterium]
MNLGAPQGRPVASFRDPGGRLLTIEGRILRLVRPAARDDLERFLASAAAQKLVAGGRLVSSRQLEPAQWDGLCPAELQELWSSFSGGLMLEHERIPFPSYPYEWPPEMLHAAGRLTLEVADSLLADGFGLKDATPYNVLFRGPEPVFVDVLSVERRQPGNATWLPHAQFVRTFLLPLLASRNLGVPLEQVFLSRREGLKPEEVYRMCGPIRRLLPPFFSLATMPTWLGTKVSPDDTALYQPKLLRDPEQAAYVLRTLLKRMRRALDGLEPRPGRKSAWSDYMASSNYSPEHFAAKRTFVETAIQEFRPRKVLDVGANTGFFSVMAAQNGASVVAVDYDPVVAGEIWRGAHARKLDILPLVVNVACPSPPTGWRNRECPAFLERAQDHFDAVFLLALVHHLLVTERIPLAEIVDLAATLTRDLALVEYIDPQDSMFRRLVRGREELHRDLTREVFEAAWRRRFQLVRCQSLPGATRTLYLLRATGRV